MKLLFKQKFFSWFDSYDIFYEDGSRAYTVEGQLSWGHKLVICDSKGQEVGCVKEELMTLMPRFALYLGKKELGHVKKGLTLFRPSYQLDFLGWQIDGDFLGWNYSIMAGDGSQIARLTKEVFNWTDTYVLDIRNPEEALYVLMVALAIDAVSCAANN